MTEEFTPTARWVQNPDGTWTPDRNESGGGISVATDTGGGGGPTINPADVPPPPVAPASVLGSSTDYAREDHTHRGSDTSHVHYGGSIYVRYHWSSANTAVDPGSGGWALANAGGQSRTLALSEIDHDGFTRFLGAVLVGDIITVSDDPGAPPITAFARYVITSAGVDHGTWWSFTADRIDGTGVIAPPPVNTVARLSLTANTTGAGLSDTVPLPVALTGAAGTGGLASRNDHVHAHTRHPRVVYQDFRPDDLAPVEGDYWLRPPPSGLVDILPSDALTNAGRWQWAGFGYPQPGGTITAVAGPAMQFQTVNNGNLAIIQFDPVWWPRTFLASFTIRNDSAVARKFGIIWSFTRDSPLQVIAPGASATITMFIPWNAGQPVFVGPVSDNNGGAMPYLWSVTAAHLYDITDSRGEQYVYDNEMGWVLVGDGNRVPQVTIGTNPPAQAREGDVWMIPQGTNLFPASAIGGSATGWGWGGLGYATPGGTIVAEGAATRITWNPSPTTDAGNSAFAGLTFPGLLAHRYWMELDVTPSAGGSAVRAEIAYFGYGFNTTSGSTPQTVALTYKFPSAGSAILGLVDIPPHAGSVLVTAGRLIDLDASTTSYKTYVYETTTGWSLVGGSGGSTEETYYQPSPPSSPVNGDIWVDSDAVVTQSQVAPLAGRNMLRNGNFDVWQRGPGPFTVAGGAVYMADGWKCYMGGGTATVSRQAHAPGTMDASTYFHRLTTSGFAGAAGDYCVQAAVIEGASTLSGKQVTLSFDCTHSLSATAKLGIEVEQNFGTGGSPSALVQTSISAVTLTGTATATRYSVTFTMPSTVGKTLGTNNNDFVAINLWWSAGSTYAVRSSGVGTQNGNLNLWAVQLEAGPVSTPYEMRFIQQEWAICRRYFKRIGTQANTVLPISGSANSAALALPIDDMRSAGTTVGPVVTTSLTAGTFLNANGPPAVGQWSLLSQSVAWMTTTGTMVVNVPAAGSPSGNLYVQIIFSPSGGSFSLVPNTLILGTNHYFDLSAEL